ncbi:hypothetical protein NG697_12450 [Pseudarthrobacter sp. MDT3-26]|uniref:hypothetical protein n=1 Tax=Pseudarthrobacter raffinosi TaxID=2953651 RepID=UPI00208F1794|nr:hypothetical protein [Pseudarthrobacter sp. MDT3-26]MCO4263722.1 hypothetical protein [Pseudarthrobacter sp. MDT3-26]
MCRSIAEAGNRAHPHCLIHSAEGKAEARAAGKLQDAATSLFDAIKQRLSDLGTAKTGEESEQILSRWRQMLSQVMGAWDKARVRLREKRDALAKKRAEHYAEKVAAVKNTEKRAAAEVAVRNAEAAQLEFEAAEDAHEEAHCMEMRTREAEGFCSANAVAHWDHSIARAEAEDARTARDQAWEKLKPIDDKFDPRTGAPTPRKQKYLAAQRYAESTARIETYLEGVANNTPVHSEAVADLEAAKARLEAARVSLTGAKAIRHSALSMGRPPAEAWTKEEAVAA